MLTIETRGTWSEMGTEVGRRFATELRRMMDRFLGLLPDTAEVAHAAARVRALVEAQCPELIEETNGMAAGAGVGEEQLFRYRFFVDVRGMATPGCSTFFARGADGRPWLGRTCDIEAEDHWAQFLHIRRPAGGVPSSTITYLGMASFMGINGHGVGLVGASAAPHACGCEPGTPGTLLGIRALHNARSTAEVEAILTSAPMVGKGSILIAADADGNSTLFEVVPGRRMLAHRRAPGRTWQAGTNFYPTGAVRNAGQPAYLYNAYARYGRIVQALEDHPIRRDGPELQRLLAQISQPGPYIPAGACPLETAYATLFDLRERAIHVAPGNPNTVAFQTFRLSEDPR